MAAISPLTPTARFALENNDITAEAFQGAGEVQFAGLARGIFGTEVRERQTSENDITASSAQGPQFAAP